MNITDLLSLQAALRPNAITICGSSYDWSYEKLDLLVWRVAAYFYQNGIRKRDIVAQIFDNELTLVVSLLATAFSIGKNDSNFIKEQLIKESKSAFVVTDIAEGYIFKISIINTKEINTYRYYALM